MNLMSMIISFSVSAIILYFINVYFDMGRRRVSFKNSFKYLPNLILALMMSASLNIFHWGVVVTIILMFVMKFLLDISFNKGE
jgi:hypothetical protein